MALEGKSKRAVRPDWIIRQEFHLDGNLKVLLLELPQIHLSLHLLLNWNTLSPQPVSLHEATLSTGDVAHCTVESPGCQEGRERRMAVSSPAVEHRLRLSRRVGRIWSLCSPPPCQMNPPPPWTWSTPPSSSIPPSSICNTLPISDPFGPAWQFVRNFWAARKTVVGQSPSGKKSGLSSGLPYTI